MAPRSIAAPPDVLDEQFSFEEYIDIEYSHTWWNAPRLDGIDCDECGPNETDLQAARRPDGTYDVTVTYGCFYGADLVAVTLDEAIETLTDWRYLAPEWVDQTITAMKDANNT